MTDIISRVGRMHLALLALCVFAVALFGLDATRSYADEGEQPAKEGGEEEPAGPALEEEAPELPWVNDWEAAKAQAAKEGKDLVINFTGSDWCGWCMRLEAEVFSKPEFIEKGPEHFVFVYLDSPRRDAEAMAKVKDKALIEKLFQEYGCRGWPSILVTFADGTPYGRTGYKPGGPEEYLKHLADLKSGGAKMKAMLADGGRDKVEVVKSALEVMQTQNLFGHKSYEWVLAHVEKLAAEKDAEGTHGLADFVKAEKERRALAKEDASFNEFLGKFRGGQIDWNEIADYMLGMKYGKSPMYAQVGHRAATELLKTGALEKAKGLIDRLDKIALFKENARAGDALKTLKEQYDAAVKAAAEGEGEEEGSTDEPDAPEGDGGEDK